MEILIAKIQSELVEVVNKFVAKKECSRKEVLFLMSKSKLFMVHHFYIIWKMLKNPPVGRPIVAGYNWILTPASIFAGHFLKEFYCKFDGILTDSLSLVKIWKQQNLTKTVVFSQLILKTCTQIFQ